MLEKARRPIPGDEIVKAGMLIAWSKMEKEAGHIRRVSSWFKLDS